jgi:hypothetical protein
VNVDQFEAVIDPLEMRDEKVAHLRRELIDEEGPANIECRLGLAGDRRADAGRQVEKGNPDRI